VAEHGSVAIFEARVTAIETVGEANHVHMDVVQTWRAAEHEHVEVVTAPNEAACGFTFAVGHSYLVYASALEGDAYRVSLCSRTRRMEDADDDRGLLGSGVVPVDIEDAPDEAPAARVPPTHAGCASCSASRASSRGGWIMIAMLAIIVSRRR
jgi:hypothetical protein